ncbi:MAG TPA: BPSS1780 family membrane protein, partial [Casimicrobiaceae bacterium]
MTRETVWIKRAYAMFRAAPLRWLLLLFIYYLLIALLEFGPVQAVGQFVAPLLKPVFAVGFLAAAWSQERGIAPRFEHLFQGFRSNLLVLVPLGAVFLAGITLAVVATTLIDDGRLIALISGAEKPTQEALASGPVQLAMLFGVACAMPSLLA